MFNCYIYKEKHVDAFFNPILSKYKDIRSYDNIVYLFARILIESY